MNKSQNNRQHFTSNSTLNPNIRTNLSQSNIIQNDSHVIIHPEFNGNKINYDLSANLMDGRFNPLFTKTILKNITIDSRFRDNYYDTLSTNFLVNLPMKINKVLNMKLGDIELPLTFYNISRKLKNDYFWINIFKNDKTSLNYKDFREEILGWYFIRINEGNYTVTDMINELNKQLKLAGAGSENPNGLFGLYKFNIDLNETGSCSGRIIFQVVDDVIEDSTYYKANLYFNLQETTCYDKKVLTSKKAEKNIPPFDPTPLPLKLGWTLGFRQGSYINNHISLLGFIAEGLFEALGPRYLFLVVDDFNNNVNNTYFSAFNSSILNKDILARISISNDSFSVQTENNYSLISTPRKYFGPIDIQKMKIQLLDEYGRVLDINNMDFSFSIIFECLYNN